ncbi:hypothetical protein [Comamonas sp.]|uniref:hypothetical protein n=1 Tax=Comamonas sp. TaxID=34028 RepID=UPI003A95DF7C
MTQKPSFQQFEMVLDTLFCAPLPLSVRWTEVQTYEDRLVNNSRLLVYFGVFGVPLHHSVWMLVRASARTSPAWVDERAAIKAVLREMFHASTALRNRLINDEGGANYVA